MVAMKTPPTNPGEVSSCELPLADAREPHVKREQNVVGT